jgi:DNA-directed RNA polymerase specialized sigma24 family protein
MAPTLSELEARVDALYTITHVGAQIEQLQQRQHEAVRAAREAGCTWEQIAERFGVTRQAVHQRFGK